MYLVITTLILLLLWCTFQLLKQCVCSAALITWILSKGYTPPSDVEMKACLVEVWKRVLKINR